LRLGDTSRERTLTKHGGLCELTDGQPLDRVLLRDIFFDLVHAKGESHVFRRRSLLLILEICRQFSAENWLLDDDGFAGVVYFGEVANDADRQQVRLPAKLQDIATRWRMFYFHHYMGVALEGLFSWLVSQPAASQLAGTTVESLVAQLDQKAVRKRLSELLHVNLTGSFGDWTPAKLYATQGIQGDDLDAGVSKALDNMVLSLHPFAEDDLEILIRSQDDLYSSTGLALPLILLATTLARYTQWEATNYGKWLAAAANDPFLDLVPPVLTMGLARHFGKWWTCLWRMAALAAFHRYLRARS
jgi:hypothetical protein